MKVLEKMCNSEERRVCQRCMGRAALKGAVCGSELTCDICIRSHCVNACTPFSR